MGDLLFVCTGNTCRSPLAAALAQDRGLSAASAGLSPAAGDAAAPNARRALWQVRGLCLEDHEPRGVSEVDLSTFARVVAMDPTVARRLEREYDLVPPTLVTWAVPDPYGRSLEEYRRCVESIAAALDDTTDVG